MVKNPDRVDWSVLTSTMRTETWCFFVLLVCIPSNNAPGYKQSYPRDGTRVDVKGRNGSRRDCRWICALRAADRVCSATGERNDIVRAELCAGLVGVTESAIERPGKSTLMTLSDGLVVLLSLIILPLLGWILSLVPDLCGCSESSHIALSTIVASVAAFIGVSCWSAVRLQLTHTGATATAPLASGDEELYEEPIGPAQMEQTLGCISVVTRGLFRLLVTLLSPTSASAFGIVVGNEMGSTTRNPL